jgi:hypothetical protein
MIEPIYKEIKIELTDCKQGAEWGIVCHAAKVEDQEGLGFCWVPFSDLEHPVLRTLLLRSLTPILLGSESTRWVMNHKHQIH